MCARPGCDEAGRHDHSRITHQEVRRLHRRRRRHLHRPARPGHRLPRPQRRRQVHHACASWSASPRPPPAPPPSTAAGSPTCPTPASRSASCSTPPPSTPAAPAARSSPSPSARWACPRSRVDEMLDLVSLTGTEAERRVRNYSLGMRQRLGIATALIGDPEVLILDEPANGLDPAGIRWMRDLLRDYADRGGTVLLSSHLLHEIEVIADDLVVIGNGRIVAQGTKAELLAAAGTLVRTAGPRRPGPGPRTPPASPPPRPATAPSAPTPTPSWSARSPSRPASPSPSCAPPTAPAWRRCSSSSPPTPNEKEQQHEHRRRRPEASEPARPAPRRHRGDPAVALIARRAAQDVRHPLRLLADGQHRHHRRARDRRRHPVRAGRASSPTHLRRRDRLPDGGHPADDRDPVGHQRVEPAQRPDHVHPGAAPRPGDRRQGDRRRRRRRRLDARSRSASARSATSSARRSPATDLVWDIVVRPTP